MTTLNRKDLDRITAGKCSEPKCAEAHGGLLFFHSKCHPDAPTWASYQHESGVVKVECATCRAFIFDFKVSE